MDRHGNRTTRRARLATVAILALFAGAAPAQIPPGDAPPKAAAREPETLAQALERLDKLEFDLGLAIGVGFGSQNVVNNFISGLILLAERPIKLGDLVEMEGVYGNVERIGLRSTRVRTGDNVHIIVPNALFLENKVINWTHRDPKVRITITVGIEYGSPTREAERLMKEALANHAQVLAKPGPAVLFRDFGDDALIFEIRFWIHMRTMMERLQIESDIRFRIDEVFREAGIVIAFPQRDVHLDTAKPLDVRVVPTED